MTKKRDKILGFYFANDNIIHVQKAHKLAPFSTPNNQVRSPRNGLDNIIKVTQIIKEHYNINEIVGIGLAVPGPFETLDKHDKRYGYISKYYAPKRWQKNINPIKILTEELKKEFPSLLKLPVITLVSQVGAIALGNFNQTYSKPNINKRELGNHLYIMADAGIGAALIHKNELFQGTSIVNIGHSIVHRTEPSIPKQCPIHKDRPCLNTVASLGAIKETWGMNVGEFIKCSDHEKVSLICFYIAQAISNLILFSSPVKVIVGGRIANNPLFLPLLHEHLCLQLKAPNAHDDDHEFNVFDYRKDYISKLPDKHSGVKGCVYAVENALEKNSPVTRLHT